MINRRNFFFKAGVGLAAANFSFAGRDLFSTDTASSMKPKTVIPKRLAPNAVIGLIAPGSPVTSEKMDKALKSLKVLGFKVKMSKHLASKNGYLAGTDAERLEDLHWAFSDPEVEAVWCVRGGYGCARLLPQVDFDLIRRNPKIFIGYSDITALHLAIQKKTGLVTFHGPVGTSDYTEITTQHLRRVLLYPTARYEITLPEMDLARVSGEEHLPEIIVPGAARGKLTGGNLSLVASLVGTDFCPVFKDKIVFIEEVGEQPYRVDRMLTQLLQGTDLKKCAGIALGVFQDCKPEGKEGSLSLSQTLRDRLGNLGIPVMYGLPFGHISNQATLPYGVLAELDTEKKSLILVEWAVK